MIKIGIIGLGHLGKTHLKLLQEIDGFEIVGLYDIDTQLTNDLAKQFNLRACNSYRELLEISEAIDIITPSVTHFKLAAFALEQGKHVFIEKPVTPTVEEALKLLMLNQKNAVIQIGHVERFNPAYTSCVSLFKTPHLIEFKRFAIYNPRGTDVSVTLDLMVHDLDILLDIVKSQVKNITAHGRTEISNSSDVAEATLEFENGCIATLITNRNASYNQRETIVYQDNNIIQIDLLHKKSIVTEFKNLTKTNSDSLRNSKDTDVLIKYPNISPSNAIKDELIAFHKSITTGEKPAVTLEEAIEVLKMVQIIDEKILNQTIK
ncbi:MAG: Gfo/Idh/MocA family oxidoreductase [Bacteroidetes bacterium]|nr:Gfo/Idh/MocA family oxidoreductase [Bacteroidota bacterium]